MTDAEQIQYNRFLAAGYDPGDARTMIERGVWLGTQDVSPQTVAEINQYRAERDRRKGERGDVNRMEAA